MKKILVTKSFPKEQLVQLKNQSEVELIANESDTSLTEAELKEKINGCFGVISQLTDKINSDVISAGQPTLKIIANFATGYDNIDIKATGKQNVWVTNTPAVSANSVAEFTIALIFAAVKRIDEGEEYIQAGKYTGWQYDLMLSHELKGQTLGIIGTGQIGGRVAELASCMGMKILYNDLNPNPEIESKTGAKKVELRELLSQSDIVSIHVPLIESTRHLISTQQLEQMQDSAILINTSRGPVIDEQALAEALSQNKIAGAALDVFEFEPKPLPELLSNDKVITCPHIASATYENRKSMADTVIKNIIAALNGDTPPNLIK